MRRRHHNATQKLNNNDEDKTRLEQEVIKCGSGKEY